MRHDKHSLYKNLQGFLLRNAGPLRRALNLQAAVRERASRRLSGQLAPSPTLMQVQSLKEWKTALLLATDPEQPNRLALRKLYESLMLDNHLMATVNNRIEAVQGAPFKLVDKNGAENPQITALFKKAWFIDFVRIALMSRYTGTKVIELYELREDGHLKQIREIDMAHVVAQKGIIVKEPGDSNGWPYKQGVFADYYLQVGSDGLLGLFAQLAPIVLAKKLAVGSWLDYIEKFGVPPIFMFTDREDRQRMEELYQALSNFKSSHFTVGRGQERVEIGNTHQSSSSSVFQDLIQLANAEISKRINGATGTTDEKAHVGAARVHAEMLKTKVSLDKFFIEVLVNEELLPKLTKLSPLYKATAAYRFAWDETESLSLAELIETVSHLSAYYQIDTQYLSEKTGIPIKGRQQNTYPATSPSEPELGEAKKKGPAHQQLTR